VAAGLAAACGGGREAPLLTYFNGDHDISVRYPTGWKTEQAEQEGVWYRYFLGPPAGPQQKPAVSATLLVGKLEGKVEDYAQTYLAGNQVASSREEERPGAQGRSYLFSSPDGATRYSLLLLKEGQRVVGLYTQGEAPLFERHFALLQEMAKSLTLERPANYPERRNERFGFSLRVPPSWRETRNFSGGGTLLMQFQSPPLLAEAGRQTIHAYLNLAVEPLESGDGLEEYYLGTRKKLGDSFLVLTHSRWRDGYVDLARMETPVAVSRIKRFYRVDKGRGYSLSFEAREDVHVRVSRWYDLIASSLKTESEHLSR
jgi:hypothetical protein